MGPEIYQPPESTPLKDEPVFGWRNENAEAIRLNMQKPVGGKPDELGPISDWGPEDRVWEEEPDEHML